MTSKEALRHLIKALRAREADARQLAQEYEQQLRTMQAKEYLAAKEQIRAAEELYSFAQRGRIFKPSDLISWANKAAVICNCIHGSIIPGSSLKFYPHDSGIYIEGSQGRQWVYFSCPGCGYDWALWKLANRSKRQASYRLEYHDPLDEPIPDDEPVKDDDPLGDLEDVE